MSDVALPYKVGDRIAGRYEVGRLLGWGGMGIVYLVHDLEFDQSLAAKTIRHELLASPYIVERFLEEARTWIRLGRNRYLIWARFAMPIDGRPFVFTEYVEGGSLRERIARQAGDVRTALRIGTEVCKGMREFSIQMKHMGEDDPAHCDLKPENILFTGGNPDEARITDFGLAKVQTGAALDRSAGTPQYMAPEQFRGVSRTGVRSDVYSFGIMLYEMLTGRLPFIARSWEEWADAHKSRSIPDPRRWQPAMPDTLRALVFACTEKNPLNRPASFTDIGYVLGALHGPFEYVLTPDQPFTVYADPPVGPATLVNQGISLYNLDRAAESLAVFDRALATDNHHAGAWYYKGRALAKLERYEEALRCFDEVQSINHDYEDVWFERGNVLAHLRQLESAIACFDRATEIGSGENRENAWVNKGKCAAQLERPADAILCFDRAIALRPESRDNWFTKGLCLDHFRRHAEAVACFDRMIETNGKDVDAWLAKGTSLAKMTRFSEALTALDTCLSIEPANGDAKYFRALVAGELKAAEAGFPSVERYCDFCIEKGNELFDNGKLVEAVQWFDNAFEADPRDGRPLEFKAVALARLGEASQALVAIDKAISLSTDSAQKWYNKGKILTQLARHDEAVRCYQKATQLKPGLASAWFNMAVCLATLGERRQATTAARRAVELNHSKAATLLAALDSGVELLLDP